ncbi:MAG: NosD domain-containing protein, partial [Halobacteriales archaeon]
MNVTPGTTIDQPGYYVLNESFTNSSAGIEINSSDVILDGQGHTLVGTDSTTSRGVHAQGTGSDPLSNVTVKNLTLDNWSTGLVFTEVDGGHTHNIVASNNSDTGILYHYATNGLITNSTVRETGVNTGTDGWGVHLLSSDNNTVRGNNVSDPGTYVTGLEIDGQDNTVTRNYISGPQWAPVILTDNTGNLVYDNYLNGSPPYEFGSWEWNANTTWNVSKRPGPNIVGGAYIGGNYWAKPDGTGFSQTHVDSDGDGFVDQSHKTDHLPLAATPGVKPGIIINEPGYYSLNQSFIDSSAGIDIASSDVILDGQGHTLDGSESSSGDGVFVYNETVWNAGDRLSNVTVKNLTLTDWRNGVQFVGVDDGSIEDSKARSNDDAGVKFDNADNNSLRDNDLGNNDEGIDLSDSNNNTVTRNRVSNNDYYGIDLVQSYTNLIYDNYFQNEVNAYFSGNKSRYNIWNVSKRAGTNIVGDPFIGGNYWATPAGTGFSQTHPDLDRDGFSDEANIIFFSDHTDQHPLCELPHPARADALAEGGAS